MYSLKQLKRICVEITNKKRPVQNYGLDTVTLTFDLTYDIQYPINSSMSRSGPLYQNETNSIEAFLKYLQAKYKHLATVTLPFDLWSPNLNRSSLSPSGTLCQIWRNSFMAFLRYRIHRIGGLGDLWPPKSNQVLSPSGPFHNKFEKSTSRCFQDIMFSNMVQTSQWPWPSTYDCQNLFSSSLSHSEHLCKVWRKSLQAFLRYCVHKKSGRMDG